MRFCRSELLKADLRVRMETGVAGSDESCCRSLPRLAIVKSMAWFDVVRAAAVPASYPERLITNRRRSELMPRLHPAVRHMQEKRTDDFGRLFRGEHHLYSNLRGCLDMEAAIMFRGIRVSRSYCLQDGEVFLMRGRRTSGRLEGRAGQ